MEQLVNWRRTLHAMPELGHEEYKTADFLEAELRKMGLEPKRILPTGIIADIQGSKPGRRVMIRADIDGLPIQEESDYPFVSQHKEVMHACGHDGHMAIVLGTAAWFVHHRDDFAGTIRILFQPSEEKTPGGALPMIEKGALEGVDAAIGLHLWSVMKTGQVGLISGGMMAAADRFVVKFTGRGGHASQPHLTSDAVLVAAQAVVNLQTIVSRKVDPARAAVVTVGTIHGGANFNIISETATITGTIRTFDEAVQENIHQEIRRICEQTASMMGATADVTVSKGYPAVVNPERSVEVLKKAYADASAPIELVDMDPSMGGEDFSYFLQKVPGAFFFLGAMPTDTKRAFPHHHPRFTIDEEVLPMGVELLTKGALAFLNEEVVEASK